MDNKKFEVIYNIGVEFGGVGIGNIAYNAVKWGAYKHGHLKRLLCRTNKSEDIDKSKIITFQYLRYLMLPFRALQIIFRWDWICPFPYVDPLYGYLASKRLSKCDIYHGWLGYSAAGIQKAKKFGAITIIECASPHPRSELLRQEYKNYLGKFEFDEKILKRNEDELSSADYVLVPSEFVKKSLLDNGFKEEQIITVPFGVDLKKFTPKKEKKDNKFRVIFVGSVQLRKGIQYILKAWDELKLKNAELIVVGRAWPDAQKIVEKYKNNPSINFVGFAEPQEYYKQSDIFVSPSIEEGSALVSYEAMASGLPIVATYNTGSVARDKKDGFIIPIRDVEALKEKIRYFYNNPKKVVEMGRNARKNIENYSWEKYGNNLVKEYERVLKKER
jgi:glycosyltransferase involved in cell wall biosynthesis